MSYWVFLAPLYAVLVFVATLWTFSSRPLQVLGSKAFSVGVLAVLAGALVAVALHIVYSSRSSLHAVAPAPTGGSCQVCGQGLLSDVVSCLTCATPHHADCFDYTGRCSTYGCGCELAA